jgi:hypothetical protein
MVLSLSCKKIAFIYKWLKKTCFSLFSTSFLSVSVPSLSLANHRVPSKHREFSPNKSLPFPLFRFFLSDFPDFSVQAIGLLSFSLACASFGTSGYWANVIDIGPSYAGPLLGLSNTVRTANCTMIDHFSAFESGLVTPFLYAA